MKKAELVERLMVAKAATGKTYDDIAKELGLTNLFTAQLFQNQAQLRPATAEVLKKVVPGISEADLALMQLCPMRSFDPAIIQEPLIYRLVECMQHYGQSVKAIVNEKKGDGIISAIDLFMDVDMVKGKLGEDRIVVTLNGKFLPHIEQHVELNTAHDHKK